MCRSRRQHEITHQAWPRRQPAGRSIRGLTSVGLLGAGDSSPTPSPDPATTVCGTPTTTSTWSPPLAREDGRAPRVWNDYARLAEVAHEFEDTFGLRSTAGRDDNTAAARPGVKEQVTAERRGRREAPRVALRQKVKVAAASSYGFGEFTERLAAAGVTVWPRMSARNPEQITGYSVSLDDWTTPPASRSVSEAASSPRTCPGQSCGPDGSQLVRVRWPAPGIRRAGRPRRSCRNRRLGGR